MVPGQRAPLPREGHCGNGVRAPFDLFGPYGKCAFGDAPPHASPAGLPHPREGRCEKRLEAGADAETCQVLQKGSPCKEPSEAGSRMVPARCSARARRAGNRLASLCARVRRWATELTRRPHAGSSPRPPRRSACQDPRRAPGPRRSAPCGAPAPGGPCRSRRQARGRAARR